MFVVFLILTIILWTVVVLIVMTTKKDLFRSVMERHKRLDSWVVAGFFTVIFFCFLWFNNFIFSIISYISIFIFPFIFPKPKKKMKFIEEVVEWEIAWCRLPPYSKLISWFIEALGFIAIVYGTWEHNWAFVLLGITILAIGLMDFVIRFGFRKAFKF